MIKNVRIFIADDHPIFRQGLIRILQHEEGFEVVGEAGDGRVALHSLEEQKPDVAVLDVSMPSMSGLDIVREAASRDLPCEFVILTMYREEEYFNEAMDLGVMGYLLKENASEDLVNCLRAVARGDHFISTSVSHYLVKRLEQQNILRAGKPTIETLSPSERRVLKLISDNLTSKQIAEQLHLSYRTVQNHRMNICAKLGLEGYNKLLQFAMENKNRF